MVAAGAGKRIEGDAEVCRDAIASGKVRSKEAAKPPIPAETQAQYDERTPGPAAGQGCKRDGRRRGGAPRPRGFSVPDPDMVAAVERQISDRGRFAGRSELLAALHTGIDPAGLDRVLEHLERSAKISTAGGAIRWTLDGDGPRDALSAGERGGRSRSAAVAAEEPTHILSMAERLSADLDNDRPYNEDIERRIADCEAGRPIGRTYTAEEYMRHLEQEHGIGAMERPE